jgi:hypothetical protein
MMARFFREVDVLPDGRQLKGGLYRRERDDDLTGDSVFRRDGKWHFTSELSSSLMGYNDIRLLEISESVALKVLEEVFDAGTELHAPMVVDGAHRPPPT